MSSQTDEDAYFLRNLYKIFGEPASPTILLTKALIEDRNGKFSVEKISATAERLGFRVQVRDCTRDRRRMRFTFRPGTKKQLFLRWIKEGG